MLTITLSPTALSLLPVTTDEVHFTVLREDSASEVQLAVAGSVHGVDGLITDVSHNGNTTNATPVLGDIAAGDCPSNVIASNEDADDA